jgi:hypothetical protein
MVPFLSLEHDHLVSADLGNGHLGASSGVFEGQRLTVGSQVYALRWTGQPQGDGHAVERDDVLNEVHVFGAPLRTVVEQVDDVPPELPTDRGLGAGARQRENPVFGVTHNLGGFPSQNVSSITVVGQYGA